MLSVTACNLMILFYGLFNYIAQWGQLFPEGALLKFIYSEKATKFCEISNLILSYVVPVKSKVEISKKFVAFSEYMNFKS